MKAARIFALALVALLSGLSVSIALAVAAGALVLDLLMALFICIIASAARRESPGRDTSGPPVGFR